MPYTIHAAKAAIKDGQQHWRDIDVFASNKDEALEAIGQDDTSGARGAALTAINNAKNTATSDIQAIVNTLNTNTSNQLTDASAVANMIAQHFDQNNTYENGTYIRYTTTSNNTTINKLYRLTADHAAGVTWENTSKVEVEMGDQISDLKNAIPANINSALSGIRAYVDKSSELVDGYHIPNGSTGATIDLTDVEEASTSSRRMAYALFDVSAGDTVILKGQSLTGSTNRALSLVTGAGLVLDTVASETANKTWTKTASVDCKCLINVVSWTSGDGSIDNQITLISNDNYAQIEKNVQTSGENLADLMRGYKTGSEYGTWEYGYYNSSLVAKSATDYARIPYFASQGEMVLIAKSGYFIQGGYKTNGTVTYVTRKTYLHVPATADLVYISISPDPYDGTGKTITLTEAENALRIINLTPTSDYNKYKNTYYGFEMYNRVAFVGDSYTVKRSTYNKCWGQIIGQKTGIDVALFGHSGYNTGSFISATGETDSLSGMLAAAACDLYWLGFGINDSSRYKADDTYLGSMADISGSYTSYPDTFYGNYGRIIESIQATFPSAKIVLCKCIYNSVYIAETGSPTTNIPAINDAIAEIAEHYSIPVITLTDDVFYRSPEYTDNMQATAMTHPDPIIFPGMANANMRLFAKCVAENTAYFKTSTAEE